MRLHALRHHALHLPLPLLLSALLTLAILLGACSHAPGRAPAPTPQVQAIPQDQAYRSGPRLPTEVQRLQWQTVLGTLYVEILAPREQGRFPLVVYLPGWGEDIAAGRPWRDAWAAQGYAVMVVQPQEWAAGARHGDAARRGSLFLQVRTAYQDEARARRVAQLQAALAEARRLAATGDRGFAQIDFERIVLAGFDLGADTALACSGERWGGAAQAQIAGLRGIIAISPYHDAAEASQARYGSVAMPVLNITSDADFDEYGLVQDLSLRSLPYRGMPREDKYLLVLNKVSHRVLSGDEAQGAAEAGRPSRGGERGGMGGERGGPGGGPGGGMGGPGGSPPGGGMNEGRGARADEPADGSTGMTGKQTRLILDSVSLAYLDAVTQGSEAARDWLALDAPRWLRPLGSLSSK